MFSRRARTKPEVANRVSGTLRRVASIALIFVGATVTTMAAILAGMSLATRVEPATGEFRGFSPARAFLSPQTLT